MDEIKKLVTTAPILAYYEPKKELVVQCDASSTGLGAVLLQEGKPLGYASRALSATECAYAQIEKALQSCFLVNDSISTHLGARPSYIVTTNHWR